MLRVEHVSAWYGEAQVVRDVSLEVAPGEIVTLVGRNGAGKTTLLRCVMGLQVRREGRVTLAGEDLGRLPPHRRARRGLGWVQDDRGVFATLSVEENLTLPPVVSAERGGRAGRQQGPGAWSLRQVYETFPRLAERRRFSGAKLSGGEQQMLAIARVLRTGARVLLCDEPTEGLSPIIAAQIGDILRDVKAQGVSVLLVEQNVSFAATVADRHYLLAEGRVARAMANSEVRERQHELLAYLGI
jgi:branched-chain amino acid transport system ATP-binding protein